MSDLSRCLPKVSIDLRSVAPGTPARTLALNTDPKIRAMMVERLALASSVLEATSILFEGLLSLVEVVKISFPEDSCGCMIRCEVVVVNPATGAKANIGAHSRFSETGGMIIWGTDVAAINIRGGLASELKRTRAAWIDAQSQAASVSVLVTAAMQQLASMPE